MKHPFSSYRKLFPILDNAVQLSSCSQSALSLPVRQAIDEYLDVWVRRGADWGYWMDQVALARAEFARMIHANVEDIAVLGSVSDAASAIASALRFDAGRPEVVTSTLDFPSICHVWLAQQPRGAQVRLVEAEAGRTDTAQRIAAAIDDRTALVSVSQACFYDGQIVDIAATGQAARAQGALQFVDAYQSAGSIAIDVRAQKVDILAAGAQKYLLGIPGIAFLYVRPALARQLVPTVTGWFGRVNPFAFDPAQLDFADSATRFNTGTPPMMCASVARASMALLNEIGVPAIQAYLQQLSAVAIEEAARLDLEVASPLDPAAKGANTAIRIADAAAIEARMLQSGYVVSARNDVIRIAPHFYNTADDVVGALRELARLTR
ncbi:aminotransferase class V-fold PLP-dependent enzyme [Variovorax saccharolyticus]|uniref:aminotransferase class V-fold PLP-dependent enzyme n=1 Tax=Variovorax saccharolyticus TaxID=3053516 RepID=UPI002577943C|nr:aminotransferase class V-fold PLP-dependent enzyme [Variovorax sp. J22R187]MDM0016413.1 aminotransferase class V-fold PLP-dependent enzyme [Variovorax sp. J22R187]